MKRFAVDIVVLPPAPVVEMAISLNKRLCNSNIVFDEKNCFPHVSLLMGCIREEDLVRGKALLKTIVSQYKFMQLNIPGIRTVSTGVGDVIALDIEPSEELQSLHESLVNAFSPLLSNDTTVGDVFGSDVNDSTLGWINSFVKESSFKNFWPHITIGYLKAGTTAVTIEPLSFTASRIAICHLGNYCTCREVLNEASLKA